MRDAGALRRLHLSEGRCELEDITPTLARQSGFASVDDLLKTAQHGRGKNVFLVRFHYVSN